MIKVYSGDRAAACLNRGDSKRNLRCNLSAEGKMRKAAQSGFDAHLRQTLAKNPKLAQEYARQFAALSLPTQLSVVERRKWLSQKAVAGSR